MRIIKELRKKIGINQTEFANKIGVSLRTIQLYERKEANIPMKNLKKIAEFFDMTIPELYIHEFHDPKDNYGKKKPFTKHGSVFYPLDRGKILAMTSLVLMEDHQEYIHRVKAGVPSQNAFQTGFVLDAMGEELHMAFEISGDSMFDGSIDSVPNKSIVLGVELDKKEFWNEDYELLDKPYILVCKDRVICKQIRGYHPEQETFKCGNLNTSPEYQDFDLPFSDVLQLFSIVKKQL
ncbi:helix-turn-helix domain-containing protein [Muricauda sp. 2012CJ35-5]|uniref:Helix-turn-helix domain-containing protein n=1 Tax=Flagellimonas spongiicola TaxID=2942208 RepID=A0ABT0PSW4_9FLAO|nr:helix-turn-helix transcriptional regulator [Allomuricauda spongiicola]MCL6274351.1 helix-turn-helix domain-containing protein [Allomuricauda spongiicola]